MMHASCPVTKCVVCNSEYAFRILDVTTRRTNIRIPLYVCLDCNSFFNPSGYHETEEQLESDLKWNTSVEERNKKAAKKLFEVLFSHVNDLNSILEIGAGTGSLLSQFKGEKLGYDINCRAVAYGKAKFNIDLRCEEWHSELTNRRFDLLMTISVMEHISNPRPLLKEMCNYCDKHKSYLFVSVPFLDKDKWNYLHNTDYRAKGTPFFDNDVHVTHFSSKGLIAALTDFGATECLFLRCGLWNGVLANFSPPLHSGAVMHKGCGS